MYPKVSRSIMSRAQTSKSRREFLQYGAAAAGASILMPLWPRWAMAQTATFDYYISPTGSDANAGTLTQPWALSSLINPDASQHTSQIAANQAKMAGKRIGLIAGTYNGLNYVANQYNAAAYGQAFSTPVFVVPPGSASASTYVASCDTNGNYSPRAAIIDGGMTNTNNPGLQPLFGTRLEAGCQYITIDGLEIRNANDRLVSLGFDTAHTSPGGAPGVIVQNCYIHGVVSTDTGSNSSGITCYRLDVGSLIHNNYVTSIVNSSSRNSGIELWGCIHTIVEYNTVVMSNAGASPIYIKNSNNYSITIRYNYVDTSQAPSLGGSGAVAWDLNGSSANTSYCYNNIIISTYPFGCNIMLNNQNTSDGQVFYNNTFIGTPDFQTVGVEAFGAANTLTFYNNILAGSVGGGRGEVDFNANSPVLVDYNPRRQRWGSPPRARALTRSCIRA
jgi:hypothetical protein